MRRGSAKSGDGTRRNVVAKIKEERRKTATAWFLLGMQDYLTDPPTNLQPDLPEEIGQSLEGHRSDPIGGSFPTAGPATT